MGTMVVLAGLTGIVFLIIRSMIRDKKKRKIKLWRRLQPLPGMSLISM